MVPEELNAWVLLFVAPAAFLIYVGLVLLGLGELQLVESAYEHFLVGAFGSTIGVALVTNIVARRRFPENQKRDRRDDEIERAGGYIAASPVVIGGFAALGMAMFETHHFWIANAIYLSFVLASVLSSGTKIVAYRRGLGRW